MKIAIITLHSPMNCGSVLQAYALYHWLQMKYENDEVSIINYVPSYIETEGKGLRTLLRKTIFFRAYKKRKNNFKKFIDKNCHLTPLYTTYQQLIEKTPQADVYITGSDQLWNPCFECGNDPAYYLEFVNNVPKISYATSMGTKNYSAEQLSLIVTKIKDYSFVSLRESCSYFQLKNAGINNIEWVCDPTFLLTPEHYNALSVDYKKLGKYVAVYLVERSILLDTILERFRLQGYKIVGVGGYLKKYKCDIHYKDAGPAEFIGLIRDSSFVVATSFHAAVFSQIFQKQFCIIPPKINAERIEQLLEYTEIQERIITNTLQVDNIFKKINYEEVQKKIDLLTIKSKTWLIKAIEEGKKAYDTNIMERI